MNWTEITLTVPVSRLSAAEPIAAFAAQNGLYIEDYSDMEAQVLEIAHIDLIDEELLAKSRETAVIHMFLAPDANPAEYEMYLSERLTACGIDYTINKESVDDVCWGTAWRSYYKPTRVGKRLVVVPTWEEYRPREDDIIISMDPGMAFGTGTHETTRLCLCFAEKYVKHGASVLDLGCGSGILSIAAILLGADNATAVDIDEVAVRVAVENAAQNGIPSDKFTPLCGDMTADKSLGAKVCSGKADVIFANIVADVIIKFAPLFGSMLNDDGKIIVGGIIDPREGDVMSALSEQGFVLADRDTDKGWVGLVFAKLDK